MLPKSSHRSPNSVQQVPSEAPSVSPPSVFALVRSNQPGCSSSGVPPGGHQLKGGAGFVGAGPVPSAALCLEGRWAWFNAVLPSYRNSQCFPNWGSSRPFPSRPANAVASSAEEHWRRLRPGSLWRSVRQVGDLRRGRTVANLDLGQCKDEQEKPRIWGCVCVGGGVWH